MKKTSRKNSYIMKTSLLFSLGLILLLSFSCEKKPVSVNTDPKPIAVTEKSMKVISAGNRFGFEIFQEILKDEDPDKNLMISPLSIEMALSMTYNGAGGDTKKAFEDVLHTDELSSADINQSMYDLREALTTVDPRITMEIANSIWYRNTFHVEDAFLDINRNYYDAEVKGLDFSNPASINIINGWVDDKTHHKIPEIIDDIDPMTIMFLINAVYFNGTWKYRFDKENTRPMEFYVTPDKTIQADMMYQKGD
ncbi:MAG TPA: serpin family protein, partial [Bacteroidetes bacterium]|nr:serpin family protein [Bacteroidota bacterium]